MSNVTQLRPTTEGSEPPQDHELTLESAIHWIRELECRLARMERTITNIKVVCPLAAKAAPP